MGEMIRVTDNFAEGAKIMEQVARKAGNTVGLMRQCSGIMHDEIETNLAKEGRPNKWKPLAASTIRGRRSKGHWPGKILQVRGRLANSFQEKADNNNAVCGTNVKYAAIQHFGGSTKQAARARLLNMGHQHAARMGKDRNGEERMGPGRAIRSFTKAGKGAYTQTVAGKAYSITIPARPILYCSPEGVQRMIDAAKAWLVGVRSQGSLVGPRFRL